MSTHPAPVKAPAGARRPRPTPERPITGFLIDPASRTIVPKTHDGKLASLYEAIGCELVQAATFCEDTNDFVFVDEEGVLPHRIKPYFFVIAGYPQPLCGKGFVLGLNGNGNTVAPFATMADLRRQVGFIEVLFRKGGVNVCGYWAPGVSRTAKPRLATMRELFDEIERDCPAWEYASPPAPVDLDYDPSEDDE